MLQGPCPRPGTAHDACSLMAALGFVLSPAFPSGSPQTTPGSWKACACALFQKAAPHIRGRYPRRHSIPRPDSVLHPMGVTQLTWGPHTPEESISQSQAPRRPYSSLRSMSRGLGVALFALHVSSVRLRSCQSKALWQKGLISSPRFPAVPARGHGPQILIPPLPGWHYLYIGRGWV